MVRKKRSRLEVVAAVLKELIEHPLGKTKLASHIGSKVSYIYPLLEELDALGMIRSEEKEENSTWSVTVRGVDLLRRIEELYRELNW